MHFSAASPLPEGLASGTARPTFATAVPTARAQAAASGAAPVPTHGSRWVAPSALRGSYAQGPSHGDPLGGTYSTMPVAPSLAPDPLGYSVQQLPQAFPSSASWRRHNLHLSPGPQRRIVQPRRQIEVPVEVVSKPEKPERQEAEGPRLDGMRPAPKLVPRSNSAPLEGEESSGKKAKEKEEVTGAASSTENRDRVIQILYERPVVSVANGCVVGVPGGGFVPPGIHPQPSSRATLPAHLITTEVTLAALPGASVAPVPAAPAPPAVSATSHGRLVTTPQGEQVYEPPVIANTVALVDGVEVMEPKMVKQLLDARQCLLVDVRGDDRKSGLIPGAIHEPAFAEVSFISRVPGLIQRWANEGLVVFTCQYSAHRAPQCANWYKAKSSPHQRVAILRGGFRGWEGNRLPVDYPGSAEDQIAADTRALHLGGQILTVA